MTGPMSRGAVSDGVAAPVHPLDSSGNPSTRRVTVVTGYPSIIRQYDTDDPPQRHVIAVFSEPDNAVRYMYDRPGHESLVAEDYTLDEVNP